MGTVLDVLHVLTAVFIVGPMAILPMTAMRALRAGQGAQVTTLARSAAVLSLASLAVAILGFGVLGTSDPQDDLSITTPWVLISLTLYLVALALNLLAVVPALRRAGMQLQASAGPAPSAGGDYSRIAASSGAVSVLLAVVVVLMVWKP